MLPKLHDDWFRAVTGASAPEERRATCARCAMAQHPGDPPASTNKFSNDLKCCTYTPRLANFLVGRILADPADDELSIAGRSALLGSIPAPYGLITAAFGGKDKKTLYAVVSLIDPTRLQHAYVYSIPMLSQGYKGRAK